MISFSRLELYEIANVQNSAQDIGNLFWKIPQKIKKKKAIKKKKKIPLGIWETRNNQWLKYMIEILLVKNTFLNVNS